MCRRILHALHPREESLSTRAPKQLTLYLDSAEIRRTNALDEGQLTFTLPCGASAVCVHP